MLAGTLKGYIFMFVTKQTFVAIVTWSQACSKTEHVWHLIKKEEICKNKWARTSTSSLLNRKVWERLKNKKFKIKKYSIKT